MRGGAVTRADPNDKLKAETTYLFRHALLRDAAYQLQLPGDRAKLHEVAFFLLEEMFGGRAPDLPALDSGTEGSHAHPTDEVCLELAEQARQALAAPDVPQPELQGAHRRYLRRAAELAALAYDSEKAAALWLQLAALEERGNTGRSPA
jgi:hypothetical protein